MTASSAPAAKKGMRTLLFDARKKLTAHELASFNTAIASHCLDLIHSNSATRVAAYLPVSSEPGGPDLCDLLLAAGCTVLLPVCAAHRQLNWAPYEGPSSVAPARFGLLEPITKTLEGDALSECDLILVPALAANRSGYRLGKGGGFYDIALASLTRPVPTALLLFDSEIREDIPLEPHDSSCDFIVTQSGIFVTDGTI